MTFKDKVAIVTGAGRGIGKHTALQLAALTVPPNNVAYGVSKKVLIGMSEARYEKAKDYTVKVWVIYPGMTDTEMLRDFNPPVSPEKWMKTEYIVGCTMFLLMQSGRVVVKDIVPWSTKHDQIQMNTVNEISTSVLSVTEPIVLEELFSFIS